MLTSQPLVTKSHTADPSTARQLQIQLLQEAKTALVEQRVFHLTTFLAASREAYPQTAEYLLNWCYALTAPHLHIQDWLRANGHMTRAEYHALNAWPFPPSPQEEPTKMRNKQRQTYLNWIDWMIKELENVS